MKMPIYTVYDSVAQDSGPVFEARNDGIAIRYFRQLIDKENIPPEDYVLFRLGEFDHEAMKLEVLPSAIRVPVPVRTSSPAQRIESQAEMKVLNQKSHPREYVM